MLNAAREGTRRVDGVVNGRIGMVETVETVRNHPHYSAPLGESDGKLRGRGLAFGFWRNNAGPSNVVAGVMPDGRVTLNEGSVDIGGSRPASRAAARRSPRNPGHRRQPAGHGHRFYRLHVQHRRQRRRLQDRMGSIRSRPGHQETTHREGRDHLGNRQRECRVRRRCSQAQVRPRTQHDVQRTRPQPQRDRRPGRRARQRQSDEGSGRFIRRQPG